MEEDEYLSLGSTYSASGNTIYLRAVSIYRTFNRVYISLSSSRTSDTMANLSSSFLTRIHRWTA